MINDMYPFPILFDMGNSPGSLKNYKRRTEQKKSAPHTIIENTSHIHIQMQNAFGLSIATPPDGEKLLMVAIEMIMCLLALLYAFPIIPSCIIDNFVDQTEVSQWFSVTSTTAMRAALETLLKTSEVLEFSLPFDRDTERVQLKMFEESGHRRFRR